MIKLGGLVNQKAFGKFEMGKVISNPFATAFIKEAEGSQDHEVSMANNSLDTIIKMATELKAKMGENEKDIPAWIQDHITNAENFISQASSNYHEYGQNEARIAEDSPCWKGYKQVGMKDKNGRQVPNCVPEGVVNEGAIMGIVGGIAMAALGLELLASDGDGGLITNIIRDIKAKYKGEPTRAEAWEAVVKDWEIRKFARNNANDIVKKGKNYKSKELEDLVQQKLNKNESVVNEAGVPKMYVKYAAVQKKVRELEDKQKAMGAKYFAEKDPKKKAAMMPLLKKGTEQLAGYRRNLADIEDKYINSIYDDGDFVKAGKAAARDMKMGYGNPYNTDFD